VVEYRVEGFVGSCGAGVEPAPAGLPFAGEEQEIFLSDVDRYGVQCRHEERPGRLSPDRSVACQAMR
jgi:hypothetical protein